MFTAMKANIHSLSTELLLAVIESTTTEDPVNIDSRTIFFANEEALSLSQVNRHLRLLCLPQLYKHVVVVITHCDRSPPRSPEFEHFRRIMQRKPHLAKLIRDVDIYHSRYGIAMYELESLAFLPNLSWIHFPDDFAPCRDLLSIIASHPRLSTAHWDTMKTAGYLLTSPSLPAAALRRIHIDTALVVLAGEQDRVYSSTGDISVRSLTIRQMMPPMQFFSTFSDLSRLAVHVHFVHSSQWQTSQPIHWFPAFMERHPKLRRIELNFWTIDRAPKWPALEDVPFLMSLHDAAHRRQLLSSFSFRSLTATRVKPVTNNRFSLFVVQFELESSILDVIRCIGSSMPVVPTLVLRFIEQRDASATISVDDFVSVFHHSLPDQVCLGLYYIGRIIPDYQSAPQYMDLVRLLASGMLKLEHVEIIETKIWSFSVKRDEQGEVQVVNDNDSQ